MRATVDHALRFVEVRLPSVGEQFGAYLVEAPIGAGGMGTVYRARQATLARPVALKVMKPEIAANDAEAVPRFLREARVAASLSHPGIVTIYDVGAVDGTPYIAMEWLDGRTLRTMMRLGELSRAEKIALLGEIAEILAHAHAHGVVHRDLKPANVVVDRHGRAKLLDFGIAKRFVRANTFETRDDVVLGTPAYMPPEAAYAPRVDARFDQWAWGVIGFELLTARRPAPDVHDEDPVLEAILARATASDPEARFPSMEELLSEWRTATATPEPAPPPVPIPPPAGRSRGALLFFASAVSVVLIAAIALAAFEHFRPQTPPARVVASSSSAAAVVEPSSDPAPPASIASAEPETSASAPPPTSAPPARAASGQVTRAVRVSYSWRSVGEGATRDIEPVYADLDKLVGRCAIGAHAPPRSRIQVEFDVAPDGRVSAASAEAWIERGDYAGAGRPLEHQRRCIVTKLDDYRMPSAIGARGVHASADYWLSGSAP